MTHATGNGTWKDFPDTTTKVTAARLENTEAACDRLYASEYAGVSRTRPAVFRAYRPTNWPVFGDVWVTTGWTVTHDTESRWTVPGGTTPSYYTIPYSGRVWDLYFKWQFSGITGNNAGAAKISIGTADVFQSIVSDSRFVIGGETNVMILRPSVPLTLNDRLYFGAWCSASTNAAVHFGGVVPEIVVRDVGPY
jgi:hypothetical protein